MKKLLYTIALLISGSMSAQTLTDYLPTNTTYLFSINFAQLNAKSQGLDYTKYLESFVKARTNYYYPDENTCDLLSLDKVLKDPKSFGIDIQTNVYIYTSWIKDTRGTAYLFRLDKPETLEAQLNTTCAGQPASAIQKRHLGQAVIYVTEDMSVAINGNVGLIFRKEFSYRSYAYEYPVTENRDYRDSAYLAESGADNYMVDSMFMERLNSKKNLDYDKEQETYLQKSDTSIAYRAKLRFQERINEENTKKFNAIFDLVEKLIIPQQENMSSNRNFIKIDRGKHDAYVFLNTLANLNSEFLNPFRFYGRDDEDYIAIPGNRVLTDNISSAYTIDFENGKATMRAMTSYNKHVYPYMEKAYGVKQDKNLFKYIDAENLLGYISVAVNAKELAKFYEDFYREMLENFPKRDRDKDIMTGMELFYAMLDKEMLFNSLNGRSIIACTGFADIKVKYSTYDYDEEFKKTERTEERIEKQPKMVWVSAIGNKENARKLFDIISRFSVFRQVKKDVFAFYGNRYNAVTVYFALVEDVFIVTNDVNMLLNNPEGFPKNRQMPKSEQKFISQHNLIFKIYGQKMLEGIQDTYFRNGETMPWFTQLMSSMGDVEMYDSKPTETAYESTAVITLKDQSANALYQLLKVMSSANER